MRERECERERERESEREREAMIIECKLTELARVRNFLFKLALRHDLPNGEDTPYLIQPTSESN